MKESFNKLYIIKIVLIAALGGYLFGSDLGAIPGVLPFLQKQFNLNASWTGFTVAILAIGCIIGCVISSKIADKYGRKYGLIIAGILFFLASIVMVTSSDIRVFIFARTFEGIAVGIASIISPMYIAEISPATMRGRMVSMYQLTLVVGIAVSAFVDYNLQNIGDDAWRYMFGCGIISSLVFFIGAFFIPESPRWLAQKNKTDMALKVLKKLGSVEFANSTLSSISKSLNGDDKTVHFLTMFKKAFLPSVMIGLGLAMFQQMCGVNVVFNYLPKIFESIGASREKQLLYTVFLGVVNLLFTFVAILLIDRMGRKPLMLFGAGGLAILYIISIKMLESNSPFAAVFLLSAIAVFSMSLAPVTWVLISEIYPNKIRGVATSITVLYLWLCNFVVTSTFPVLFEMLKERTFYIYVVICFIGFIFIWTKVKETKGKTLEEIGNATA